MHGRKLILSNAAKVSTGANLRQTLALVSYFLPGLWHFAAAMAFAVAFGTFKSGNPLEFLQHPEFIVPLLLCSSALFFVPDKWSKKGPLKFLHYPLPDWDVLLLGPASHRNWITHSALLPLLVFGAAFKWPNLTQSPAFVIAATGVGVGIGSHLFWDCVGSERHTIVVIPYWFSLREATSRLYLLTGAAISLAIGGAFAAGVLTSTFAGQGVLGL